MKKALENRVKLISDGDPNGPMALDLRRFHADAAFLGEPVYACLNRSHVAKELVKIIAESPVGPRLQVTFSSLQRPVYLCSIFWDMLLCI
jgi:hypothetical protein